MDQLNDKTDSGPRANNPENLCAVVPPSEVEAWKKSALQCVGKDGGGNGNGKSGSVDGDDTNISVSGSDGSDGGIMLSVGDPEGVTFVHSVTTAPGETDDSSGDQGDK